MTGRFTVEEILSQPAAWRQALTELGRSVPALQELRAQRAEQVVFTGCGSTYYLALAAAASFQALTGVPARGVPASELWLSPESSLTSSPTLLIAVSRSGATTETLRAVETFKAREGRDAVITLSCYGDSPLSSMGDVNLVLESGQERSIAQTRAFSVLLLGTLYLAHVWGGASLSALESVPDAAAPLVEKLPAKVESLASAAELERFYFLGSGPRYGLAAELSLKMKEMSLSHSEPFHFLEFRHGPKSMVNERTLLIGLVSDEHADLETAVLAEMSAQGAATLSVGPGDQDIRLEHPSSGARQLLYLPVLQRFAVLRAQAKGLDPDRPHNLTSVVTLA